MITIKCLECGKTTRTGSGYGKYCPKCKEIVLTRQQKEIGRKEKLEKKRKLDLKCIECGTSLTDILHARRYCLNCKKVGYVKTSSRNFKERYWKNREKYLARSHDYYQIPKNKERHKVLARESAARKRHALKA